MDLEKQINNPPTTAKGDYDPIDVTNTKAKFEKSVDDNVATTYDTPIATTTTKAWRSPEMDGGKISLYHLKGG